MTEIIKTQIAGGAPTGGGGGGGGDAYTKAQSDARYAQKEELTQLDHKVGDKQDKLIAGEGITIADDGKTISAQGGGGMDEIEKKEMIAASYVGLSTPVWEDTDGIMHFGNLPSDKSAMYALYGIGSNTSLQSLCMNCANLEYVFSKYWNTTKVQAFNFIFYSCKKLKYMNTSLWDTSNTTSFASMFSAISKNLPDGFDMSKWNMDKTNSIADMFNTTKFGVIDFSGKSFPALTAMERCFAGAEGTIIDISDMSPSQSFTATNAFSTCTATEIRIGDFSKASAVDGLFQKCYNLETLSFKVGPSLSFNLEQTKLTHESMVDVINSLPTVDTQQTLKLTNSQKSQLSASEIAIATAKGWTIA